MFFGITRFAKKETKHPSIEKLGKFPDSRPSLEQNNIHRSSVIYSLVMAKIGKKRAQDIF